MKMEPLLSRGRMIGGCETEIKGKEIMTVPLFAMFKKGERKEDIAYSVVRAAINSMVNAACDTAVSKGLNEIGVTGGVSYNGPICDMIEDEASKRGMSVIQHRRAPNGDGGISLGQAMAGLRRLDP
jgi:hydrogenase maturation protein HypF